MSQIPSQLKLLLISAVQEIYDLDVQPEIIRTKQKSHGDYATNIAMVLAKAVKKKPRDIAESLQDLLIQTPWIAKIEIAGPGFINFFVEDIEKTSIVAEIRSNPQAIIESVSQPKRILLEYVSCNPTGPVHVGHGRAAVLGSTLANILESIGHTVYREYYVNNAGTQIDVLALSVLLRHLDINPMPYGLYQGDYIIDIANDIPTKKLTVSKKDLIDWLSKQSIEIQNAWHCGKDNEHKNSMISHAINWMKEHIPTELDWLKKHSYGTILDGIRQQMLTFRVPYDHFFYESDLVVNGDVDKSIQVLKERGLTEMRDGALWFKSASMGDDKDRVLIKANGDFTYFATDLAYHYNKSQRCDVMEDIFGADHHGYVARLKSGVGALAQTTDLNISIIQFANLIKDGRSVAMSTRHAVFETVSDVYQFCGIDATRYFFMMRSRDQTMEFDMNLARSKSQDNPVYYIQYAHARISKILDSTTVAKQADLSLLREDVEQKICLLLGQLSHVVHRCAKLSDPQPLCQYTFDLAKTIHHYYNAVPVLKAPAETRDSRLALLDACRIVLSTSLEILAIDAPRVM